MDLVVAGTKAKSTMERGLMGSDAESIVRYCRYPVSSSADGSRAVATARPGRRRGSRSLLLLLPLAGTPSGVHG